MTLSVHTQTHMITHSHVSDQLPCSCVGMVPLANPYGSVLQNLKTEKHRERERESFEADVLPQLDTRQATPRLNLELQAKESKDVEMGTGTQVLLDVSPRRIRASKLGLEVGRSIADSVGLPAKGTVLWVKQQDYRRG